MTNVQDDLDYQQHVKEDTVQWENTVQAAAQFIGRLQDTGPALLRDEFAISTIRLAMEVLEKAGDRYLNYDLPREMDHAANMAIRLAMLVLVNAPQAVVNQQYANLRRALDQFQATTQT